MPMPKPCKRCNKRFVPVGKYNKVCWKCVYKANQRRKGIIV